MSAEFNVIIVPVDGSEGSQRAARFAARLAKATHSKVNLLHVFPATPNEVIGMASLSREDIEHAEKQAARKAFDKALQAMGEQQQEIEEKVLFGDPAEEIIRYVGEHPDALVVMGRRGLSRMESLLLGSVSEKVVRYASGAVTIVH
jgi:nucleotide-binding universal stress UspA family protein